ncbi:MAG: branched-chain amino acid ABC transporter permease [Oscillospiraceae bacterium]
MQKLKNTIMSHGYFPVVLLVLSAALPLFIKTPYLLHICNLTFYMATGSMAWSILGGMTGQNSLGHATFMGLGAYVSSLLVVKGNFSPWIAVFVAIITTGIMSMILFYPCFILKGPYFTLVTIAFGEVFRNFFLNWDYAGKASGIILPFGTDSLADFRFVSKVPYFYAGLIMVICVYLFIRKLERSKLGFALKTIREDEDVASAIGIDPTKYKVIAVGISAAITAFAGFYYAQYLRYIDPDIMLQTYSTEFVLPAIIGGIGYVSGPILGAFLLIPLSEFLRAQFGGTLPGLNLIVYSIVLILMIRFQPTGILGWWHNMKQKRLGKKDTSQFDTSEKGGPSCE